MRIVVPPIDVSSVNGGGDSLGSTPTLSSVSAGDSDDPLDDPEFTRMHFEGIEAGEAEMRAQNEAFREFFFFSVLDTPPCTYVYRLL